MPLIKRTEFAKYIQGEPKKTGQVWLFFGERFLSKESADLTVKNLLQQTSGNVHTIDGDTEDPSQTLARLMSFSLLPGNQIYRVTDSKIFHSKTVISELWDKALQSNQDGRLGPSKKNLLAMAQASGIKIDTQTPLSEIPATEWKKIFDFEKPSGDMTWADQLLFESRDQVKSGLGNIVDQYMAAFDKGIPTTNLLILTAETVDKRQRLFKYIKKIGTVVDCTVASGASTAARNEQKAVLKEMILKTLATYQKKIDPVAVDLFLERVGFHPIAVVMETEKLAHYVGENSIITINDLNAMVSRNREDALYELTDAFGKRQTEKTLTILNRLLEQGVHSLAILATMRNYLRKLLIFKAIQLAPSPIWRRGMNPNTFQNSYLPELKAQGEWADHLTGHPYALFMSFSKASEYSCKGLKTWLTMLLEAEFRLKGSPLQASLVLEELFISMLKGSPKLPRPL